MGSKKTSKQIRKIWEHIKMKAKKIYAEQMQLIAIGGLSQPPLLDPLVDDVISIIKDEQDSEMNEWEAKVQSLVPKVTKYPPEKSSREEKEALAKIVMEQQDIVCSRESSFTVLAQKSKAWLHITEEFNSSTGNQYNIVQVRKLWDYICCRVKYDNERLKQEKNNLTEGDKPDPPDDLTVILMPYLEKEEEYNSGEWEIDLCLPDIDRVIVETDSASESLTFKCETAINNPEDSGDESTMDPLDTCVPVPLKEESPETIDTSTTTFVGTPASNYSLFNTSVTAVSPSFIGSSDNTLVLTTGSDPCSLQEFPTVHSDINNYSHSTASGVVSATNESNSVRVSSVLSLPNITSLNTSTVSAEFSEPSTSQSPRTPAHKKRKCISDSGKQDAYDQVLELHRIEHKKRMEVLDIEKTVHVRNLEIAKLKKKYWEAKLLEVSCSIYK
ncbi:uncharacterized protein LOC121876931 isoform X2 [Homarus americanus]|nr:uncharacterized protein LOC121876931 isoform X2 [Homarus americanus]